MWERELEIIESLGKLYPKFKFGIEYKKNYHTSNSDKSWWIYWLCKLQLKRRLPQLEEFIREHNWCAWDYYKIYFDITGRECGKEDESNG